VTSSSASDLFVCLLFVFETIPLFLFALGRIVVQEKSDATFANTAYRIRISQCIATICFSNLISKQFSSSKNSLESGAWSPLTSPDFVFSDVTRKAEEPLTFSTRLSGVLYISFRSHFFSITSLTAVVCISPDAYRHDKYYLETRQWQRNANKSWKV
jgi:hypothetical protein